MRSDYYERLAARISDVLDAAGYRGQVLDARITHSAGPEVLVGRAATLLAGEQVEEEVVSAALEKVGREDRVREELAGGASLAEVWARHRVL